MRGPFALGWCLIAATACSSLVRPSPSPKVPMPVPIAPFEETPRTFVIRGQRFTPGELAIVRVCIAADRTITSADLIESSGDRKFDQIAVVWARQVRIRAAGQDPKLMDRCGAVRVEIRPVSEPRVLAGPDVSLG